MFALYIGSEIVRRIEDPDEAYAAYDDAVERQIRHGTPALVELYDGGNIVCWSGKQEGSGDFREPTDE